LTNSDESFLASSFQRATLPLIAPGRGTMPIALAATPPVVVPIRPKVLMAIWTILGGVASIGTQQIGFITLSTVFRIFLAATNGSEVTASVLVELIFTPIEKNQMF
jgi:hypothetical protein